jgi:serine/threonine protein kinase
MPGVGQLVAGRYRIVRALGGGGFGRVWLATDQMLDRQVAIKSCSAPDGLSDDERDLLLGWMLREAQAAGRVSHPHVISIYDVLPGEHEPWIVMEYVPSRPLSQVIDQCGPLPVERVAAIGLALVSALTAASRVGVLHLDVKPGNVLIADDGRVVLTDFGPAVTDEGIAALARSGMILGTPNYISPERLFEGVSTAQADLWSLGATLYHAVEGRPPYLRETSAATLRARAESPPDPPRLAGPLTEVLDGLLRRDPDSRMAPAEAEDRMRRLTDVPPVPVVRIQDVVPQRPAPPRRRRRIRTSVTAVAAVLAACVTFALLTATTGRVPWRDGGARAQPVSASWTAPPDPFVLPRDFRWWNDPGGFSVAVPGKWPDGRAERGAVVFRAPGGQPSLRISGWQPKTGNVVAALVERERGAVLPAYKRIRIEALPRSPDAIWEYTFRDRAAGPVRGLEQVVAVGDRTYLIEWRAPRTAWVVNLPDLAVVLDSFRPARGA